MRQRLARWLAIFTGVLVLALSGLFATFASRDYARQRSEAPRLPGVAGLSEQGQELDALLARGRSIYEEARCPLCHAIAGVGNPRHPLDGVGHRLTREQIGTWIVAPKQMNPAVRKPAYELTDDELDAIVSFLASGPPMPPSR